MRNRALRARAPPTSDKAAGGQGAFNVYQRAAGRDGHFIIDDVGLWATDLDQYVRGR